MRRASLCLLLAVVCSAAPQIPSNTPATDDDDRKFATLGGKVIGEGGIALSKATVTMYDSGQQAGQSPKPTAIATSDTEGKFKFERIEPGSYTLTGEHPGYLMGTNGGRRTTQALTGYSFIPMVAGQHVTGVIMDLVRASMVSGKTLDEDGDPLVNVTVQALAFRWVQGQRQPVTQSAGRSDDRGEFKLANMAPGRVVLSFVPPQAGINAVFGGAAPRAANTKPGETEERYVNTFYPGVTELNAAIAITVPPGEDVSDLVVKLKKSPVYHVRGKVTGDLPLGETLRVLVLEGGENTMPTGGGATVAKDGTFDVAGLPAGDYKLGVMGQPQRNSLNWLALESLRLVNEDVDLTVNVQPAADFKGRIVMEKPAGANTTDAPAGPSPKGIRISLTQTNAQKTAFVEDDGSFTISGVRPGKYRVAIAGIPAGGYLKSLTLEGRNAMEELDLSGGAGAAPLEAHVSMSAAEVDGRAITPDGQQVKGATIVALIPKTPQPAHDWLYKRGPANSDGQFSKKDVAPGDYWIIALEQMEGRAEFDPEWYKIHHSRGTEITVKENDHLNLTLKRVTPAQISEDDRAAGH